MAENEAKTYVYDATDIILGRMASKIANGLTINAGKSRKCGNERG